MVRELSANLLAGACTTLTAPTISEVDGQVSEDYTATNAQLHECQYMRDTAQLQCVATGACPTYEEWSECNPQLSPLQGRRAFLAALKAYQSKNLD